jgi:hypothetical protein
VTALRRARGVAVVLTAVVAGLAVPAASAPVSRLTLPLVALLVFATLHGTDVTGGSLRSGAWFAAGVLLFGYGVVPAATAAATAGLNPTTRTALLVVAVAPTTAGSALVWTAAGGGDELLATVGSVATLAVAPVAVPAVLASLMGDAAAVPAGPLLRDLVLVVGGGGALARVVPAASVSDRGRTRLSLAAVFLLVYGSVGASALLAAPRAGLVAAAVGLCVVALAAATAVGGRALSLWTRESGIALCFVASLKNLGVSLAVLSSLGADGAVLVAALYAVQQVAASALAGVVGE